LDTHEQNARVTLKILAGKEKGARRDLILINAGCLLYVGEVVKNFRDGYELVNNAIDSGEALKKVEELVKMSKGDLSKFKSILSTIS
jgi:anthranilate phosphoribosyltransferase